VVTSVTLYYGGARRPMALASYGGPSDAIKGSGGAKAHRDPSIVVDDTTGLMK
jgi:hypothetical protein